MQGECEYLETVYGTRSKSEAHSRREARRRLGLNELDSSKFACHHCDNPMCINVDHLYIGDAQTNADDMVRRGRCGGKGKNKGWSPELKGPRSLTVERAAFARWHRAEGRTLREIGDMLECTPQAVHYLLKV